MSSTTKSRGVSPSKPSSTALVEPCPRPVVPREPYISARTRRTFSSVARLRERLHKAPPGDHGADGVGTGGPNANLEKFKDADGHRCLPVGIVRD